MGKNDFSEKVRDNFLRYQRFLSDDKTIVEADLTVKNTGRRRKRDTLLLEVGLTHPDIDAGEMHIEYAIDTSLAKQSCKILRTEFHDQRAFEPFCRNCTDHDMLFVC